MEARLDGYVRHHDKSWLLNFDEDRHRKEDAEREAKKLAAMPSDKREALKYFGLRLLMQHPTKSKWLSVAKSAQLLILTTVGTFRSSENANTREALDRELT